MMGDPSQSSSTSVDICGTYGSLLDAVSEPLVLVRCSDRSIVYVNTAGVRLFEKEPQELTGRNCHDFICPARQGECPVLDLGMSMDHGEREIRVGEEVRPVLKSVRRLSLGGEPLLMETFHPLDVATEYLFEEEISDSLSESNQRYKSLFLESYTPMLIIDPDSGFIVDANRAAAGYYGYDRQAFERMRITDINQLSRSQVFEEMTRARLEERNYFLFYHKLASGEVRTVEVYSGPMPLGGKTMLYSLVHDVTDRVRMEELLAEKTAQLEESHDALEEQYTTLKRAWDQTIEILAYAAEVRDPYTAGHQKRVAVLSKRIAVEMGFSPEIVEEVEKAALVHDLGKFEIPSEILSKPGRISEIEFRLIQRHAESGYNILKKIELPWPLAEIVYQHHERMDGSGYPRGLEGEQILMQTRIIAVADVVEAMSSHRPYRPALGIDAALEEIEKNAGIRYDTDVAKVCLGLFREKGYRFPED